MGLSQHYINIYTEFKVSLINLLEDFSLRIFMGLSDTSGEVWVISKDENRRALFIYTSQEVAISTSNQDWPHLCFTTIPITLQHLCHLMLPRFKGTLSLKWVSYHVSLIVTYYV